MSTNLKEKKSIVNETDLQRLDTIQGLAMKMILNIKGSTSYNALDVEAGVLPIRIRLKQVLANYGCKLMRKTDSNNLKVIIMNNLQIRNVGRSATPADKTRMAMNAMKDRDSDFHKIEKELSSSIRYEPCIEQNFFVWQGHGNASNRTVEQIKDLQETTNNFLSSIDTNDLICFTDGSVQNPDETGLGPCGAGIAIYEFGIANNPTVQSFKVSEKSTPYHGEIMAIKQALVKCLSLVKKRKRKKIHLLSDCQSAILTVTSCVPNDNCTQEITDILKISHDLLSVGTKTSIS